MTFKGFHSQKLLAKFHSDGRVKVLGIYFQQQGDEQRYEVNDLFSCDRCWGYEWPEPMENGRPLWSWCGGPELEPMTMYKLGQDPDVSGYLHNTSNRACLGQPYDIL